MVNSTSGETAGRPARAAVYIRVSSADQVDNFSLEAQEQAARQYVEAHGWDLHRVYADEGHSARTTNRPAFQMMLRDAQLRQFNVILVHKLDRLFRNLGNLLECVQALDRREVRLVSVSEDIDFSSASGRMLLTNLGMISEFYSNNLREETIKGKRQRALNGLWNSCIPFGYQKGECLACSSPHHIGPCPNAGKSGICPSQLMVPHPHDSEGVREAFELHASGKSYQQVATYLNRCGYRPMVRDDGRSLGRFSKETVRSMLQNETYLGFVKYKGELHPGLHPPLVSRELFERSQQVCRDAAVVRQEPGQKNLYLLSGLVRCSQCGYVMRGAGEHRLQGGVQRYYRDAGRERGRACNQKRIKAELVEGPVERQLSLAQLPLGWQDRVTLLAQATPEVEHAEQRRRMLRARERRLTKLFVRGDLPEKVYVRQRQQLRREAEQLKASLAEVDRSFRGLVGNFESLWARLTPLERKRVIQVTVKAVFVQGEHIDRIEFNRPFAALLER